MCALAVSVGTLIMTAGKATPTSFRIGNPMSKSWTATVLKALLGDMGRSGDCAVVALFDSVITWAGGNTPGQSR